MNMVQKCYQNFIMIDTSFYQTNLEPPDKANDPIHDPNVQLLEIPRVMNECYTRYTQLLELPRTLYEYHIFTFSTLISHN